MEIVYENPWFRVAKDGKWHWIEQPRSVAGAVVFLQWRGRVAMVEQYRFAQGESMLEAPRGYAMAGEKSVDCAIREGHEETGLLARPEDVTHIGDVAPDSGILASRIGCYFARVADDAPQNDHDDEVNFAVMLEWDDLWSRVRNGQIMDGFTLSGLMLLQNRYSHLIEEPGKGQEKIPAIA